MGISISGKIPNVDSKKGNSSSYLKSLKYMGYEIGDKMLGKKVDYVFLEAVQMEELKTLEHFQK